MLLIFVASVGFAFFPILTKDLYELSVLTPVDVSIWRFIFATPIIWLAVFARGRGAGRVRLPRRQLVMLGAFFSLAALTAFFGLERITASLYVILFFTYPAMVAGLSVALGKHISKVAWASIFLALLGISLAANLTSVSAIDVVGVGLALGNALIVAIFYLINEKILDKYDSPLRASAWLITGTLAVMVVLIVGRGVAAPDAEAVWLRLFALGSLSTAVPIAAVTAGIKLLGPTTAAIVSTVEPALAVFFAVALLGETLSLVQWIGSALVLASLILLQSHQS